MSWDLIGGRKMADVLTQEQIDKLVADKIAEATKGLLTEEEVTRRVTAEADRRVESGIQKGLETKKQIWEREYAERLQLSAEELAQKEYSEKLQSVTAKEKEIQKKANKLEAKDMLSEASIPKAQYEKLLGMLVSDDDATTKANVQGFIDMYNSTKVELETSIKSQFANIPPPHTGGKDDVVTQDSFRKMGYADKLAFKQANPELYKQYIK